MYSWSLLCGLCVWVVILNVAVQELYLDQCGIQDSQFEAILPSLSRCSQLRSFSLCGNILSMAVMEKLLRQTAGLSYLTQEWYPAPRKSYSPHHFLPSVLHGGYDGGASTVNGATIEKLSSLG